MLQSGQDIFVNHTGGGKARVLHAAKVVDCQGDVITVSYTEPDVSPSEPGSAVKVCFLGPREFMQQVGECIESESADAEPTVAIRLIGSPVSAESRKCFRVSTEHAGCEAEFGDFGTCKVVDVSATGVAFVTEEQLAPGDMVEVTLTVMGKACTGRGFVQSARKVRGGYRYGLLCLEDLGPGGLSHSLQRMTMDAQRAQLRRLSGAA